MLTLWGSGFRFSKHEKKQRQHLKCLIKLWEEQEHLPLCYKNKSRNSIILSHNGEIWLLQQHSEYGVLRAWLQNIPGREAYTSTSHRVSILERPGIMIWTNRPFMSAQWKVCIVVSSSDEILTHLRDRKIREKYMSFIYRKGLALILIPSGLFIYTNIPLIASHDVSRGCAWGSDTDLRAH